MVFLLCRQLGHDVQAWEGHTEAKLCDFNVGGQVHVLHPVKDSEPPIESKCLFAVKQKLSAVICLIDKSESGL